MCDIWANLARAFVVLSHNVDVIVAIQQLECVSHLRKNTIFFRLELFCQRFFCEEDFRLDLMNDFIVVQLENVFTLTVSS